MCLYLFVAEIQWQMKCCFFFTCLIWRSTSLELQACRQIVIHHNICCTFNCFVQEHLWLNVEIYISRFSNVVWNIEQIERIQKAYSDLSTRGFQYYKTRLSPQERLCDKMDLDGNELDEPSESARHRWLVSDLVSNHSQRSDLIGMNGTDHHVTNITLTLVPPRL